MVVSRVKNIDELFDTYLIISWESGHAFHDEAVAGQRPGLVEAANLDWKITIGKNSCENAVCLLLKQIKIYLIPVKPTTAKINTS